MIEARRQVSSNAPVAVETEVMAPESRPSELSPR